MDGGPGSALVTLWLFSLAALGLHATPRVVSTVALDDWGRAVLRRSVRATWLLWALAVALHAYFWSMTFPIGFGALVPAALLLGTHFVRREARVWAVVAATLTGVAVVAPGCFSLCAFLAAATLALRAYRHLQETPDASAAAMAVPFRGEGAEPPTAVPLRAWVYAPAPPAARQRLLVGAVSAGYLALWTLRWSGGPWPQHLLWLDLLLTAAVLVLATRHRVPIALAPFAASFAHLLVQTRVVTAPDTTLEWGATLTGSAFVLLLASLVVSYWLRDAPEAVADGGRPRGAATG